MSDSLHQQFAAEWQLMQKQFDTYEVYSLVIKLVSILVSGIAIMFSELHFPLASLIAILWLQDSIWKTFQARIETRLLALEKAISNTAEETSNLHPFQFNTRYNEQRPGTLGLCFEYIKQALRPTIAFPHVVLFVLVLFL